MALPVFPFAKLADGQVIGLVEHVDISVVPGCYSDLTELGNFNTLHIQRTRRPPVEEG